MIHTPRSPRPVSLTDLIALGFLSEEDVMPGGRVDETRRCRAEEAYIASRPRTATVQRRPRPQETHRSHSRPQTARGSSAHIHRIHVRREVQGTNKVPTRFVLDTCCICYTNAKDHAVVPCYHMCVCVNCAQRIQQCPMCRGPVSRIQKIFL